MITDFHQAYFSAISIAARLLVQSIGMAAQGLQLAQHDLASVASLPPEAL